MKQICKICAKSKGSRKCRKKESVICSMCCVSIRNIQCSGCSHYIASKRYQSQDDGQLKKSANTDDGTIIFEINEQLENEVDNALIIFEQGGLSEAERLINNLYRMNPDYYMVLYAKGVCCMQKKDYKTAKEFFEKSVKINPFFPEGHFNKAAACMEMIDLPGVIKGYQKVLEYTDPASDLYQRAQKTLMQIEKNVIERQGAKNLDVYVKTQDIFMQGVQYMEDKDWENAIRIFKQTSEILPRHVQSFGNLGMCLGHIGKMTEAKEALRKAIELEPDYEPALYNYEHIKDLKDGHKLRTEDVKIINYHKNRFPEEK